MLRLAIVIVGVVLLLLPFLPMQVFADESLQDAVFDAGHLPLLALFTLCLWWATPQRWSRTARYLASVSVAVTAALGIELVQPFFHRTLSVADFLHGCAGIGLAVAALHVWSDASGSRARAVHAAVTLSTCLLVAYPVWQVWRPLVWRDQNRPLIGDFERDVELGLWLPRGGSPEEPTKLSFSDRHVSSGRRSLEVHLGVGGWPGLRYKAGRSDWQPYGALACEIFNPGESFVVTIRIDDTVLPLRREDEFNRKLTVEHGWNLIRLPIEEIRSGPPGRDLDMTAIARLVLFVAKGEPQRTFYLDHVRLIEIEPERAAARQPSERRQASAQP